MSTLASNQNSVQVSAWLLNFGSKVAKAEGRISDALMGVSDTLVGVGMNGLSMLKNAAMVSASALFDLAKFGASVFLNTLSAFVQALVTATNESQTYARSIRALSSNSGMSWDKSAQAINNARGFGVSAGDAEKMFGQDSRTLKIVGRSYGIKGDPGSQEWMTSYRARYQQLWNQGDIGKERARDMARNLKHEPLNEMAQLPEKQFKAQMNFGQGLQLQGPTVEAMRNLDMLQARADQLKNWFMAQFATAFAPALEKGLGDVTEFLKNNMGAIQDVIFSVARWMVGDLPIAIIGGVLAFLQGIQSMMRGLASMLRGLAQGKGAFYDFFLGIAVSADVAIEALMALTQLTILFKSIQIGAMMGGAAGALIGAGIGAAGVAAFQTVADTYYKPGQITQGFKNSVAKNSGTITDWADKVDQGANSMDTAINAVAKGKENLQQADLGKKIDDMHATMKGVQQNTKETANNTKKIAEDEPSLTSQTAQTYMGYVAEQGFREMARGR